MNLIEALKTGKRFTRKSWTESLGKTVWMSSVDGCNLLKKDILADDWEVEDEKVTITKSQLYSALHKARLLEQSFDKFPAGVSSIYEFIAKELGL